MILTGRQIEAAVDAAEIVIHPFDPSRMNPNSYNYTLGRQLKFTEGDLDARREVTWHSITIGYEGYLLVPGQLYLASTAEVIGSDTYVTSLIGRSSLGRLGLFVQVTADLGHQGAVHCWTLELTVVQPLRVVPGMPLGQVSFWTTTGSVTAYEGMYGQTSSPTPFWPQSLA
ncbi:dCTP deaminase [Streptomyces sp. NBC_00576]|uniref:dCTP deaminase n=1 Tax=Streptomyces sp. NBC_00576 TaxID=2903665 RepID=UPI002E81F7F6|nr:deoxycytidine deaminase [Streptomyces sp. NBC_00576]WUB74918.1 deoxycytidine deaminase [Streptomyces sp. NBC_00576]